MSSIKIIATLVVRENGKSLYAVEVGRRDLRLRLRVLSIQKMNY